MQHRGFGFHAAACGPGTTNVLIDTSMIPPLLARRGVEARVTTAFGDETLPVGSHVVVEHRPDH